jgi:hypothetical protein
VDRYLDPDNTSNSDWIHYQVQTIRDLSERLETTLPSGVSKLESRAIELAANTPPDASSGHGGSDIKQGHYCGDSEVDSIFAML